MPDRPHERLRRLHSAVVGAVIHETRVRYLHGPDGSKAKEAAHAANKASREFWAHVDQLEKEAPHE